ncbi:TPA: WG repeat-containing protein [Clostridioides difficile]|nr:WG repeat-containing protein [Clostridioides difficile]
MFKKILLILMISILGFGVIGCSDSKEEKVDYDYYNSSTSLAFKDGLARVKVGDKWGFIDKEGNEVIKPQFDGAYPFFEDLAAIKKDGKWGFIDKEGNEVIKPQFNNTYHFSNGLAKVVLKEYGYVDKNGEIVIDYAFNGLSGDFIGNFSEGLAYATITNRLNEYIDKTGKIVIQPKFDDAKDFSEGLAGVKIGDKWGFIDKEGKIVINPIFNDLQPFKENLAFVMKDDKWGVIDKNGKVIIQFKYLNEDLENQPLI